MEIRFAEPDRDAAACAAIYAPFVVDTAVSFEERPPDATEFAARIARISATHPYLVAVDGDRVLGFAYASQHRERSAYRWAADVAVYVAAGSRRSGIGRALYEVLLPMLASQGFRIACAGVTLPNPASVALHEAVGFTPVGIYRGIGYKHGAWHDVGWWQLQLAPDGADPSSAPGAPPRPRGS
ncbi:MAG TPA: arsinothricin resistance N-acetyltransferase ArsN1 family B [Solirubrobacteraceae bacterium]